MWSIALGILLAVGIAVVGFVLVMVLYGFWLFHVRRWPDGEPIWEEWRDKLRRR